MEMHELEYPFDSALINRKKKQLKRILLQDSNHMIQKKIAILGGSTTNDIVNCLELFLLQQGIQPTFYQSEFNRYWEDVMFDNPELMSFAPDMIYIHTSTRNLKHIPCLQDSVTEIEQKLDAEFSQFVSLWNKINTVYHCPIIQNNFEPPMYRLLGNMDCSDPHGLSHFIHRMNGKFYEYAQENSYFYIHDINFLASDYGFKKWSDPTAWYMYKYILSLQAIPEFAYSLSNIIKSLLGKNKKVLALDLDNTLWGGVIGDDGVSGIELGQETSIGQAYQEFQKYIKQFKELGILLTINSKNDLENALSGLNHPNSVVSSLDFICKKVNWEPKSKNILEMAEELSLGADSFVFVDDNPAEREIVKTQVMGVATPDIGNVEQYIQILDRSGYFETTSLSAEDLSRNAMYQANMERKSQQSLYTDYTDYLRSLEMVAEVLPFDAISIARIAQLTNKSNQFNVTTKRYTPEEIEKLSIDSGFLTLYGRLTDKFGDNGIVSIMIGKKDDRALHIDLWLMSCRVLKRDMEFAMFNQLVERCKKEGITQIYGYYYPTKKNSMVKELYGIVGFDKLEEDEMGNSKWLFNIGKNHSPQGDVIEISEK